MNKPFSKSKYYRLKKKHRDFCDEIDNKPRYQRSNKLKEQAKRLKLKAREEFQNHINYAKEIKGDSEESSTAELKSIEAFDRAHFFFNKALAIQREGLLIVHEKAPELTAEQFQGVLSKGTTRVEVQEKFNRFCIQKID